MSEPPEVKKIHKFMRSVLTIRIYWELQLQQFNNQKYKVLFLFKKILNTNGLQGRTEYLVAALLEYMVSELSIGPVIAFQIAW